MASVVIQLYLWGIDMDVKNLALTDVIKHVRTGRYYFYAGAIKVKIDGSWCDMHQYIDSESGKRFCRFEHEFCGFVNVPVLS